MVSLSPLVPSWEKSRALSGHALRYPIVKDFGTATRWSSGGGSVFRCSALRFGWRTRLVGEFRSGEALKLWCPLIVTNGPPSK